MGNSLVTACMYGHFEVAKLLHKKGAPFNCVDIQGPQSSFCIVLILE